jgi:hypothetical protein
MPLQRFSFFLVFIGLVGASGCATLKHGSRQPIQFLSAPESATVLIDGAKVGQTPLSFAVQRRSSHDVRIELAGFKPFEARLEKKLSGWLWGNLIFFGLFPAGVVVDAMTGAIYNLTPEQLVASLERSGISLDPQSGQLYILAVLEADPAWQRLGALEATGP